LRHRGGVIRVLCTFVLKLFLYKWLLRWWWVGEPHAWELCALITALHGTAVTSFTSQRSSNAQIMHKTTPIKPCSACTQLWSHSYDNNNLTSRSTVSIK
jgi:hypothetical protein